MSTENMDPKRTAQGNSAFQAGEIALKAKRYTEAIRLFSESIKDQPRITRPQRANLSLCYHRAVCIPRNALRIIKCEIEMNEKRKFSEIVQRFSVIKQTLEMEISKLCTSFIELIDTALLSVSDDAESVVFYTKLKGDYYRYLAEMRPDDDTSLMRAKHSYEAAMRTVGDEIKISDPIYLGLILNFAIFQYELLNMKEEAIDRLDGSFNEAVRYLEELEEHDYAEATMILELMRDNISIWREKRSEESDISQK